MVEINMEEISKKIELSNLKQIPKNPMIYLYILNSLLIYQLLQNNSILIPVPLFTTNALTLINTIYNISKKNAINYQHEIDNCIRETEEYKKTLTLYKEFLENISTFLKSYNFDSSIDYTLYVTNLLKHGFLSCENTYNFKHFEYDNLCPSELIGARITSGTGVCRHEAALSKDILLKLGINCSIIQVKPYDKHHPERLKYNPFFRPNHALLGIVDENGKYFYDQTHEYFGISSEEYYKHKKYLKSVAQIASDEYYAFYYIHNELNHFNYQNEQNLYRFENADYSTLEVKDFLEKQKQILEIFQQNNIEHQNFYDRNKKLIREIAKNEAVLCPHGDEKKITGYCIDKIRKRIAKFVKVTIYFFFLFV